MNPGSITIGLMGDVMIGRGVNTMISARGYDYVWGNLIPVLKSTDLNIANLETAFTTSDDKAFKMFHFKADPDKVKVITKAGIGIVNLANNHILDFSEQGLFDTLDILAKAGIQYVGAGKNEIEASRPVVMDIKGIRIGITGITDNEAGWKATCTTAGTNYIDLTDNNDREKALINIERLSRKTDIVIVSIHWGPNLIEFPFREHISFAHAMIDHGATIIHGHSAHNFKGIELYKNKLILYDTGDFVDDYVVDHALKNDHSFFYILHLNKYGIEKLQLIPVLISDCQVNKATIKESEWSFNQLERLSRQFNTHINNDRDIIIPLTQELNH